MLYTPNNINIFKIMENVRYRLEILDESKYLMKKYVKLPIEVRNFQRRIFTALYRGSAKYFGLILEYFLRLFWSFFGIHILKIHSKLEHLTKNAQEKPKFQEKLYFMSRETIKMGLRNQCVWIEQDRAFCLSICIQESSIIWCYLYCLSRHEIQWDQI